MTANIIERLLMMFKQTFIKSIFLMVKKSLLKTVFPLKEDLEVLKTDPNSRMKKI